MSSSGQMSHDSAAYLENFATTRRTAGRAPDPLPPTLSPSRSTSSCCRPHAAVTSAISRSDVSRLRDSRAGNQPGSTQVRRAQGRRSHHLPEPLACVPIVDALTRSVVPATTSRTKTGHLIRRWCHPDRRSMIAKATGSKPPAHHSTSSWRGAGRLAGTGYRSCNNRHPGRRRQGRPVRLICGTSTARFRLRGVRPAGRPTAADPAG